MTSHASLLRQIRTVSFREIGDLLRYEPETGHFIWLPRVGAGQWNSKHAGKAAGCRNDGGYTVISIAGCKHRAHRLAWLYVYGEYPVGQIDHINGDPSDNRICNLREATNAQNQWNTGPQINNSSGFKGVVLKKDIGLWWARIRVEGKRINLGFYATAADAHAAYERAARKYHGEFARVA